MTRIRYVPKIHVIGNKPTNIDHVCTIEIQNIYPLYTCPRMYVRRYVCMRVQIYLSGIQNSILRTIYVQLNQAQFNLISVIYFLKILIGVDIASTGIYGFQPPKLNELDLRYNTRRRTVCYLSEYIIPLEKKKQKKMKMKFLLRRYIG